MPVPYDPDLFNYADPAVRVPDRLGFAGFRAHAAINGRGQFDEICMFLGASYFRAVGRGQDYGLSARGLAVGAGTARPEEFPRLRAFSLERPQPAAVQFSAFLDANPCGSGLLRRKREFRDCGDLKVPYGRRPSLWVEPIGD